MDNKFPSAGGGGFSIGGLTTYPQAATGLEYIPLLATNGTQYKAKLDTILPILSDNIALASNYALTLSNAPIGFNLGITQNGLWLFTANLTVETLTSDIIQTSIQDSTGTYNSNPTATSGGNTAGYTNPSMTYAVKITNASVGAPVIFDVYSFYLLNLGGAAFFPGGTNYNTLQATLLNPFYE
jgi:hypothetical protein